MTVRSAAKLFTPLLFLRIEHPELDAYRVRVPILVTAIVFALIVWAAGGTAGLPEVPTLLEGAIVDAKALVALLAAFFVAALAAVSTFAGPGMDKVMSGEPPKLTRHKFGTESLTRRRFLSFLFGYLSFVSVFYYVVLAICTPLVSHAADITLFGFSILKQSILAAVIAVTLFLGFHLLAVMMLSLHYLTDRIHRA